MSWLRGVPVIYYGDEQGFVGRGGDQASRQDMFASQVASYNEQPWLPNGPIPHTVTWTLPGYVAPGVAHPGTGGRV